MKSNLIFNGLKEIRNEDTEDMIRQFLKDEFGFGERVEMSAVHRFGKKKDGIRPIVVRFLSMKNLKYILKPAYRLRNTRFSIRQQFPAEIEKNRRKLYPVMREAKRKKKQVTLVRDQLYIDNKLYTPDVSMEQDEPTSSACASKTRPNKRVRAHSTPDRE
jgi:hypothetical protein